MCINYANIGWDSFIGFQCSYCDTVLTKDNITIDHVIPKSHKIIFGGEGNNTTPCCKDCNGKKSDKSLLNFLGLLPETIKTKKKTDWSSDQKCIMLKYICGLEIKSRKISGNIEYSFYLDGRQIKSCYTYPKAKLFAEGFKLGKEYVKS